MSFVTESHEGGHGATLQSYVTGFVLAVILTVIPFWLVMTKVASPDVLLPTVLAIGAVQMLVHLKYFLHLTGAPNGVWNISALLLTGVIVFIVIAGNLWVMLELNHNMMPWMFGGGAHHMGTMNGIQQSINTAPM